MSDLIAQRTLVKSPPELWAEVSDVGSLARHLGELGEITITRVEPETTVVWEGERASGTVELEPSGWGTKVTLTAVTPQTATDEVIVEPEPEPVVAQEPETAVAEPEAAVAEPEPEPADAPEPADVPAPLTADEVLSRSGFFSRLLRRRRRDATAEIGGPSAPTPVPSPPTPLPTPDPAPPPDPLPPAAAQAAEDEPAPAAAQAAEDEPAPAAAQAAEPEPVPAAAALEPTPPSDPPVDVQAVLSGVLDALGSAHHRPFSR